MSIDLNQFSQDLPKEVWEIIQFCHSQGLHVGLIGGITRDYLISGEVGTDFDIELRPKELPSLEADLFWKKLADRLKQYWPFLEQKYSVLSFKTVEYDIQLSLPRIEIFNENYSHTNFEAQLIYDLDFSQGFVRRDFTINAIMFEVDEKFHIHMIDPLNGYEHLLQKKLVVCSDQFQKDPVRFLRALRFKHNLDYAFESSLEKILPRMAKFPISSHYYRYEFAKSQRPAAMLEDFLHYHGISLNIPELEFDLALSYIWGRSDLSHKMRDFLQTCFELSAKKFPSLVFTQDINSREFYHFFQWLMGTKLDDTQMLDILHRVGLQQFQRKNLEYYQSHSFVPDNDFKQKHGPKELKFAVFLKRLHNSLKMA